MLLEGNRLIQHHNVDTITTNYTNTYNTITISINTHPVTCTGLRILRKADNVIDEISSYKEIFL